MRTFSYRQLSEILGVGHSAVYRWFPARRGGLVREADVLDVLNARRVNGQPVLRSLPERLYRHEALASWLTENTPKHLTKYATMRWVQVSDVPHFKVGKTTFFDLDAVLDWMDAPRNPLRRSSLTRDQ